MGPKVTVLVPVYNRERMVDEAIRSVVEQDFADYELLLVDDGSTDGTPAVLEAWRVRDPRIVVITSPANLGIPAALNLGLSHARGSYIARLDSDDLMRPHRLAAQAAALDERADVSLVSSYYDVVDLDGTYHGTWKGDEPHEVMAFLLNFFNAVGGGGQVMFRHSDVMEEGGFSVDHPATEDYHLWVRLLRRGRILTLPLVGMTKRTHADQSLQRWGHMKRAMWTSIMRSSLERLLARPVHDEEIGALLTVWRLDGSAHKGAMAHRVMREAFARFVRETPRQDLQAMARLRIARQLRTAADDFVRRKQRLEAMRYFALAAFWRFAAIGRN